MTYREGAAPSRVFYGWWVAAAFSLIIFVSTGIRFAVGPFLKPVVDDLDRGSFGRFSVGSIFLVIFLIHQVGAALGAWFAGFLLDQSGDYGLAFAVSCGLLLLGAGLSMTINVAGRPRERSLLQPVAGGR